MQSTEIPDKQLSEPACPSLVRSSRRSCQAQAEWHNGREKKVQNTSLAFPLWPKPTINTLLPWCSATQGHIRSILKQERVLYIPLILTATHRFVGLSIFNDFTRDDEGLSQNIHLLNMSRQFSADTPCFFFEAMECVFVCAVVLVYSARSRRNYRNRNVPSSYSTKLLAAPCGTFPNRSYPPTQGKDFQLFCFFLKERFPWTMTAEQLVFCLTLVPTEFSNRKLSYADCLYILRSASRVLSPYGAGRMGSARNSLHDPPIDR